MNRTPREIAAAVLAYYEFKPSVDPKCRTCGGRGETTEISGHNGDSYEMPCRCQWSKRPPEPILGKEEWMAVARTIIAGEDAMIEREKQ